jgi:hypothetical protein
MSTLMRTSVKQVADVIGVAELALRHRLALQRLDDVGIGLAVGDQLFEPAFVDRRQAAGQHGLCGNSGHDVLHAGQIRNVL